MMYEVELSLELDMNDDVLASINYERYESYYHHGMMDDYHPCELDDYPPHLTANCITNIEADSLADAVTKALSIPDLACVDIADDPHPARVVGVRAKPKVGVRLPPDSFDIADDF